MIKESNLNTIIKNSLQHQGGWAYKIPDPSALGALQTTSRPFDGFGITAKGTPVYWEAKFSKTYSSFNLHRISDHQIQNLKEIQKCNSKALCIICYGVRVKRGDVRVYVFPIEEIEHRRLKNNHYRQQELNTLFFYSIKNNIIENFLHKEESKLYENS